MNVYEGSIVTCDAQGSTARFLVEEGGRIVHVGNELPQAYAAAPRIDLGEKALLPAFGDTHIHFMSYALFSAGLDLRKAETIDNAKAAIAEFVESRSPAFVLGFGSSAHSVAEKRLLTREDIDAACPGRPAFIVKYDGHAGIANSVLIEQVKEKLGALRGFDADSGLMTQEAFFRVTDFLTGKVSLPSTMGNMLSAIDTLAGYGIGLVHSVTGIGFPGDMDVTLESLFARGLANPVAYRVFFQTMDVAKVLKRKLPRIGGCFATALDGCYGSVDAAMLEPYEAAAGLPPKQAHGILYYTDERVTAFCREANRAGLQIEMHAIGDAAFEQAVSAIAAALADFPREDHRHTIIHACLPTMRGLETCARLGIHIAVQPGFLQWEQEPLEYIESIMGKRAYDISPLRTMTDMGIVLSGGSDAPCTVPNPIDGIWAACNHYVSEQSLSIQEALNLYTRNAARISFDEKDRGSLEKGKRADMIVVNRNPLNLDKAYLRSIKVVRLLLEGKPYTPGQGKASLIARGLMNGGKGI
ncbi:MAG: metal-dependent hydrolase with the TIM-barrel fold protein [Spirochaetae bacterium HGW-Spirochaetae-9]|nr:MAG: metal-dependent hydrolase with the TIM-barrel fold protein [Spirochaetae bacterium HGW-Spirochaetae-9]